MRDRLPSYVVADKSNITIPGVSRQIISPDDFDTYSDIKDLLVRADGVPLVSVEAHYKIISLLLDREIAREKMV
jgi:hypothetical protein